MSLLSSLLNPEIVMGITDVVYNKSVSIHQDVAYLNVHNTAFKWVRMFNGSCDPSANGTSLSGSECPIVQIGIAGVLSATMQACQVLQA